MFQDLENQLWQNLSLSPGSVYLENPFFDENSYMQVQVKLFPPTGTSFNQSEVSRISSQLGQQNEFKPPKIFGPYLFTANPYPCLGISQTILITSLKQSKNPN